MLCLRVELVLAELGHVCVLPSLPVLRVDDDETTGFALVQYLVMDIGTGLALSDAGDVVAREHVAESLVEIELGAVSKVVGRLLLKLTFEVRDLFLRGFFLARELGPRLEERLVFRALKELPLLGERGLVPPLGLGNELRSSLRFTGLLFLELRLCRGKFTLRGGDTLCGCFGRALLGVALGLKQISRRRRKSAQGRRRNALAGDVCGVGEEASAGRGPEGRARSGGRRGPPYAGRLAIPAGLAPARPGRLLSDGAPLGLRQLLGSRRP